MEDDQSLHEYQRLVLEQIELDKYKEILVDKNEWDIVTDCNVIRDYIPKEQYVNLQTVSGDIKLGTFSSAPVFGNKVAYVLNTGGSIWGLDFCPKRPSNDTEPHIQYLAIGGYNTTTECHSKPQVAGEYKNAIQIWRCNLSYQLVCPLLDLCILHDYGVVKDLKWCPLGSYEENAKQDDWSKLGILSVLFGDGAVRIFVIPHPNDLRKKTMMMTNTGFETIYLRICKSRLVFKLERSTISCQDWSGYLRLACGGHDGSITIWNVEHSFKRQKPTIQVKMYCDDISTIISINWYSILDKSVFVSTDDQSSIALHNINDPYIPKYMTKVGHPYCTASWPGHQLGYFWTTAASISRVTNSVGEKVNKIVTYHYGQLWSIATNTHHKLVATSGSEGCVNLKDYRKIGKKSYQHTAYQLLYDQNTNVFKYIECSYSKISPKDHDFNVALADQTCSIHKVVWNPNMTSCGWIASGGKGGLCRIEPPVT